MGLTNHMVSGITGCNVRGGRRLYVGIPIWRVVSPRFRLTLKDVEQIRKWCFVGGGNALEGPEAVLTLPAHAASVDHCATVEVSFRSEERTYLLPFPRFPLPSSPLVPTPSPAHFAPATGAICGPGPLIPGQIRPPGSAFAWRIFPCPATSPPAPVAPATRPSNWKNQLHMSNAVEQPGKRRTR